jgi:hypothetical protein
VSAWLSVCLFTQAKWPHVCVHALGLCVRLLEDSPTSPRNGCKFVQAVGSMYVFTGGELSLHHLLLDLHVTVSEAGQAQLTVG